MIEFGASGQLITAFESGAFIVSDSVADQAKAREAEVEAKRQEQIEQDRKLNTLFQAWQAQAHVRPRSHRRREKRASSIL